MTDRNPADARARLRAEIEARTAAGRPAERPVPGLGIIVAIAVVFGGLVPFAVAFLRPLVEIAAAMTDFAPAGVALLLATFLLVRVRRSRRRALVVPGGSARR